MPSLFHPSTLVIQQSCLRLLHRHRVCTAGTLQAHLCAWGMLVARPTLLTAMEDLSRDAARCWAIRRLKATAGTDTDVVYACNPQMLYPLGGMPPTLFGCSVGATQAVYPPPVIRPLPGDRTQIGPEWDLGIAVDCADPSSRRLMKLVIKDLQRALPWQSLEARYRSASALARISGVLKAPLP